MIEIIYLVSFRRLYSFISLTITGEGRIIINARDTVDEGTILPRCLGSDFLDLLQITTCAGELDNYIHYFVLLLEIFQLPLKLLFRLLKLLNRIIPVY